MSLDRLRRRLGWRLIGPTIQRRYDHVQSAIDTGHQPHSYHKDWWVGQHMALVELKHDLLAPRLGPLRPIPDPIPVTDERDEKERQ